MRTDMVTLYTSLAEDEQVYIYSSGYDWFSALLYHSTISVLVLNIWVRCSGQCLCISISIENKILLKLLLTENFHLSLHVHSY